MPSNGSVEVPSLVAAGQRNKLCLDQMPPNNQFLLDCRLELLKLIARLILFLLLIYTRTLTPEWSVQVAASLGKFASGSPFLKPFDLTFGNV